MSSDWDRFVERFLASEPEPQVEQWSGLSDEQRDHLQKQYQVRSPKEIHRIYRTKIRGVGHKNDDGSDRQAIIKRCRVGERRRPVRDPNNPHDKNAIKICRWITDEQLGFVSADLAEELAPEMDSGCHLEAVITELTGGGVIFKQTRGVNIRLTLYEQTCPKRQVPQTTPSATFRLSSSEVRPVGNLEAVCPYCSIELAKKPSKKAKCPQCNNFIFVRTRPIDCQRVLVTGEQVAEIELQWSVLSGIRNRHDFSPSEIGKARQELHAKFGHEPSEREIQWYLLNQELTHHARAGNWGFYRNTRLDVAEQLRGEGRLKEALFTYLEVCYLDLNGPRNVGDLRDGEWLNEYPPFALSEGFLAPAVVELVQALANYLGMDSENLEQEFITVGRKVKDGLVLPVSQQDAWRELHKALISRQSYWPGTG